MPEGKEEIIPSLSSWRAQGNHRGKPAYHHRERRVEIEHLFPQAYEQVAELGPEALAASASSRGLRLEPASELEEEYAENEFIVRLDKSLSREEQVRILEEAGYRVLDTIEILGAHLVTPREAGISALGHEDQCRFSQASGAPSVDPNYAIRRRSSCPMIVSTNVTVVEL